MMTDVMVDLETMGVGPRAAIIAIGAVAFDLETGELGGEFYRPVDLGSSMEHDGIIDADTVMWWLKQSDDARKALTDIQLDPSNPDGGKILPYTLPKVLADFTLYTRSLCPVQWLRGDSGDVPTTLKIWGNGAGFDNVVLRSAYEACGISVPWLFYNDRCYRTVKAQYPHIKMERSGTHHNALDDAVSQAKHLIAMLKPANDEGDDAPRG
jgi:exodeoxyribonuclease VIII